MIEINSWLNDLVDRLSDVFSNRIWFVGLQGSYARGEATENSDIDVVVILDALTINDINNYNDILDSLPHSDLTCGFLSGIEELQHWDPSDLFHFYHDTKPIKGSLDILFPLITNEAIDRAIKSGMCNIYHGCIHNMLYEKSEEQLIGLYKYASYIIQMMCYRKLGKYISKLSDLINAVSSEERTIIDTFTCMKNGEIVDLSAMSEIIFNWSKKHIR